MIYCLLIGSLLNTVARLLCTRFHLLSQQTYVSCQQSRARKTLCYLDTFDQRTPTRVSFLFVLYCIIMYSMYVLFMCMRIILMPNLLYVKILICLCIGYGVQLMYSRI